MFFYLPIMLAFIVWDTAHLAAKRDRDRRGP
jgi:hypothetical protein